jgi:predicted dehydrogenase/threonine dehydrogenase-like Zn-dependent dehydrogenase
VLGAGAARITPGGREQVNEVQKGRHARRGAPHAEQRTRFVAEAKTDDAKALEFSLVKALLHRLDGGPSFFEDAPVPVPSSPNLLVETRNTVVSAGTERMIVEFARGNLLSKARQQPDKVRQVVAKIQTDGLAATIEAVRSKLSDPVALGYCNAGVVVECGSAEVPFATGTRVVTNGPHSEYVVVPHTLAARIPDALPFDVAAFAPLAAIGLQGLRLAQPTIGETVVVYGLGLIGLLTVQIVRANGCRVIGIDTNAARRNLAASFGAITLDPRGTDIVAAVTDQTSQAGADAVLLTLAADSDEPVHLAAAMSRKRGRIVLVGVTGLNLKRDDFYRKELSFAVSCSYGPGRYDPDYEDAGRDYPLPYVRWTEQRNFDAVLGLMASGAIDPRPLISHRFAFTAALDAYDLLTSDTPSLGIVLEYENRGAVPIPPAARVHVVSPPTAAPCAFSAGVIGAGNFGARVLIPAIRKVGGRLRIVAARHGTTAAVAARKHGFEQAASDVDTVFADPEVDSIVVLTRHDSHAHYALRALRAGKHVFVEKPLALAQADLDDIENAVRESGRILTVGFNRRFSPLAAALRTDLANRNGPVSLVLTVNAGAIPYVHWTQDPVAGGGRIAGEACHFFDLARFLVGAPIRSIGTVAARNGEHNPVDDIAHIALAFADGSTAVVHYLANGAPSFPKERVEAFAGGRVWQIDNWRRLRVWGGGRSAGNRFARPAKGHVEELAAFARAVRSGGPPPIPYDELFEVSRWTLVAANAARTGQAF